MKFAAIALVGAASAHYKNRRARGMCPHNWGKDLDEGCPNMNQADNMEDFTFHRSIHREMYDGALQGWYGSGATMVPEACYGEWMEDKSQNIKDVFSALKAGDIFGVSHAQVKGAVDDSIDMILRNIDECQMYRPLYDYYRYCMVDPENCFQMEGFFDRVASDTFKLGSSVFDIYNLATTDDYCMTDLEIIDEHKRGVRDVWTLKSTFYGFHGEWDTEAQMENKSIPEMWHEMQGVYHDMLDVQEKELGAEFKGARCPVLGFFKDLKEGKVSIPWESFGMPALF